MNRPQLDLGEIIRSCYDAFLAKYLAETPTRNGTSAAESQRKQN